MLIQPPEIDMLNNEPAGQGLIIEHYRYLDLKPSSKTMPICLIETFLWFSSKRQTFHDVIAAGLVPEAYIPELIDKEWDAHLFLPTEEIENDLLEDDVEAREKHYCACSHIIISIFYVRNRYNGNVLQVGDDCIDKFGKDSRIAQQCRELKKRYKARVREEKAKARQEQIKAQQEEARREETLREEARREREIQKRVAEIDRQITALKSKLEKVQGTLYRICEDCGNPEIPAHEPSWKKQCKHCWLAKNHPHLLLVKSKKRSKSSYTL